MPTCAGSSTTPPNSRPMTPSPIPALWTDVVRCPGGSPYGRGDIDPDATKPGLQVEITVDDPAVFTTPWSALVTYRHAQGDWPEAVCAENTLGSGTSSSSACIFSSCLVPQADQPDF